MCVGREWDPSETKAFGASFRKSGFVAGADAQKSPTFTSTELHVEISQPSPDLSLVGLQTQPVVQKDLQEISELSATPTTRTVRTMAATIIKTPRDTTINKALFCLTGMFNGTVGASMLDKLSLF